MINLFGVERTLKLPNGDEFVEEGNVAVYEEKVGPKLVLEYKTEKGTLAKLKLSSLQAVALSQWMQNNNWS